MTLQQIESELLHALFPVLIAVVTTGVGVLAQRLNAWLRTKFSTEKLFLGQQIAGQAVQFTEQVYKNLHGPDKLAVALERAKDFARAHGITYSDEQWKTLIERAVQAFNRGWTPFLPPPATAPTPAPTQTDSTPATPTT